MSERYGGLPPFERSSPTSREAALSVVVLAVQVRQRVYDYVCLQGAYGATSDEVEAALGIVHQSASARIRELVLDGALVENGERRRTRSRRFARVVVHPDDATQLPPPEPEPVATNGRTPVVQNGLFEDDDGNPF
jgi:hypothetical protein